MRLHTYHKTWLRFPTNHPVARARLIGQNFSVTLSTFELTIVLS